MAGKRAVAIGGLAMILSILAGCAETTSGTMVKDSALAQFQKGVTTEADVVKALGPPNSRTPTPNDTYVLVYFGVHSIPNTASYIPLVDIFAGGTKDEMRSVTFRFTSEGKLLDYSNFDRKTDTQHNPNLSVQSTSGTIVTDSALAQFQKGVTTEGDIVKVLGPPTGRSPGANDTYTLQYFGSSTHATFAGSSGELRVVVFLFSPEGKLLNYHAIRCNQKSHSSKDCTEADPH